MINGQWLNELRFPLVYASAFMNNSLNSLFYFRIQNTLLQVGPAVFYGGLSTLLAVVLLAASDYYPFVVFFKVGDGNEIFCKFYKKDKGLYGGAERKHFMA